MAFLRTKCPDTPKVYILCTIFTGILYPNFLFTYAYKNHVLFIQNQKQYVSLLEPILEYHVKSFPIL